MRQALTTLLALLLMAGLAAIVFGLALGGHSQPDNQWREIGQAIGYGIAIVGGLVSLLAGFALWARR